MGNVKTRSYIIVHTQAISLQCFHYLCYSYTSTPVCILFSSVKFLKLKIKKEIKENGRKEKGMSLDLSYPLYGYKKQIQFAKYLQNIFFHFNFFKFNIDNKRRHHYNTYTQKLKIKIKINDFFLYLRFLQRETQRLQLEQCSFIHAKLHFGFCDFSGLE